VSAGWFQQLFIRGAGIFQIQNETRLRFCHFDISAIESNISYIAAAYARLTR